tara:strand:- start:384 stop:518 length:135 start_codon:yes stop_codon:yes gene_type:complete
MKIKNLDSYLEDYYPTKEKIKRTKPRKKDLDRPKKDYTFKSTKK